MKRITKLTLFAVLIAAFALAAAGPATAQVPEKWCSGVKIRFFAGGSTGDTFAPIVDRGAVAAAADLGADVTHIFSEWKTEVMLQQLREAIAAKPDGIAMMGHPGDDAIMPLAQEAAAAGIKMMYQNVDVPRVRAQYGGGYVGANLSTQGVQLGAEAVRQFGFKEGDKAIVIGPWAQKERALREGGVVTAFETAKMVVIKLESNPNIAKDPSLLIPQLTAAFVKDPDVKVVVYDGGQLLSNAAAYMDAIGKKPGEVVNMGFDTSAAIIKGFEEGWIQLTSDQQPFLQGYMPILSLCQQVKFGLAPLNVDTGAGFVDTNNFKSVADLATAGLR
jgi:simple sugar transport system substrate-binding protein